LVRRGISREYGMVRRQFTSRRNRRHETTDCALQMTMHLYLFLRKYVFSNRCAISGKAAVPLCMIALDNTRAISPTNCILIQARRTRAYHNRARAYGGDVFATYESIVDLGSLLQELGVAVWLYTQHLIQNNDPLPLHNVDAHAFSDAHTLLHPDAGMHIDASVMDVREKMRRFHNLAPDDNNDNDDDDTIVPNTPDVHDTMVSPSLSWSSASGSSWSQSDRAMSCAAAARPPSVIRQLIDADILQHPTLAARLIQNLHIPTESAPIIRSERAKHTRRMASAVDTVLQKHLDTDLAAIVRNSHTE